MTKCYKNIRLKTERTRYRGFQLLGKKINISKINKLNYNVKTINLIEYKSMKEYILSYKEAELYQEIGANYSEINLEGMYIIKAGKSKTHPYGIHDDLGLQPIPRTKAIKKFKEKIDKHLHSMETGENVETNLGHVGSLNYPCGT